jgi:hypothetical protein
MLEERLKPAVRSRRRGLLSKGTLLVQYNARPHTGAAEVTTIQKLKFETRSHPSYSPDLAPSDYHVFGTRKEALRGRRFHSDDEMKKAVHSVFDNKQKLFFSTGIQKLVERCEKCIAKGGDYVGKLHLTWICIYDVHLNITQFASTC